MIAVIADVHSNSVALRAVLDDMPDVDRILCAGDVIGYNTRPVEVIELFQERDVTSVLGNHDAGAIGQRRLMGLPLQALQWNTENMEEEHLDYIRSLSTEYREEIDGVDVYMTHGSPRDNIGEYVYRAGYSLLRPFDDVPDVIILGHTHVPLTEWLDDTLVLNPGSVGQPRDGDERASYAVLDLEEMEAEIHRIGYDIDAVAEEVTECIDERYGDRLYLGK